MVFQNSKKNHWIGNKTKHEWHAAMNIVVEYS